jgi:hypothetical protein
LSVKAGYSYAEFVAHHPQARKRYKALPRDSKTLDALRLYSDDGGQLVGVSYRKLADILHGNPMNISRAMASLRSFDAIDVEGSLRVRPAWRGKGLKWENESPTITIAPELRAQTAFRKLGA